MPSLGQAVTRFAGGQTAEAEYLPHAFPPPTAPSCSPRSTYIVRSQLPRPNLGFPSTSQRFMPTQEYLWRHQNLSLLLLVLEENIALAGDNSGRTNSESC